MMSDLGALRAARERIQVEHPSTSGFRFISEKTVEDLRLRLSEANARGSEALETFGSGLTRRELIGVIRGIARWGDLQEAAAQVAAANVTDRETREVWLAWQSSPRSEAVLSLAKGVGRQLGWSGALNPQWAAIVEDGWTEAERPGRAIVHYLAEANSDKALLTDGESAPLDPHRRLARDLPLWILQFGDARQLKAEGPIALKRAWGAEAGDEAILGAQNYLNRLPGTDWFLPMLSDLQAVYGIPGSRSALGVFWAGVSQRATGDFRAIFIQQQLQEVFGEDSERHQYWSTWTRQINSVETGQAGETHFALMDFGEFSVLEFFGINNAAYFYPEEFARRLTLHGAQRPSDLKDTRFERLFHTNKWWPRADRLMRRHGARR